ncbi:MAG: hypothetical protein M3Y12_05485 [Bacteroidota bacterium]|nr:hypothetical protein [Bacteroidota bacterium]
MANDSTLEIYCPACQWEPDANAQWECTCGHHWNTFDTAGVCPLCQYRWNHTQCLSCAVLSLHIDWYHGLAEALEEVVAAALAAPAALSCPCHES